MEKQRAMKRHGAKPEMTGAAKKTGLCNRAALLKAPTASRLNKETQAQTALKALKHQELF